MENRLRRNRTSRMAPRSPVNSCVQPVLIVLVFVTSGAMGVMCVMKLVQLYFNIGQPNSSSTDVFEAVLLVLSLIATTDWLRTQTLDYQQLSDQEHRFSNICGYNVNWILMLIIIFSVLSVVPSVFESVCIAACFSKRAGFDEFLRFVLGLLKAIFLISQLLLFVLARGEGCNSFRKSCWLMVLVSTNICLIMRCMFDGVWEAIMYGQSGNDSDVVFENRFCEDQPETLRNGYATIQKYFYSFIFLLSMYAIELLCGIWNVFPAKQYLMQEYDTGAADGEESRAEWDSPDYDSAPIVSESSLLLPTERPRRTMLRRLKMAFCYKLCQYSMVLTALVCSCLFITHIVLGANIGDYDSLKNDPNTANNDAYVWVQAVYENIISGAAFVGFLLVRKETIQRDAVAFKHILLVFSVCF